MKMHRSVALLLVMGLLAAACSGTDDGSVDDTVAEEAPAVVEDGGVADEDDPGTDEAAEDDDRSGAGGGADGTLVGDVGFGLDVDPLEPESWTYMLYSIADTNLEEPMLEDVAEMATVGSPIGVNTVALVDREAGHTDQPLLNLDDWETAKLLYVQADEFAEIADLGELDMADPTTLASFIAFAVETFPADNYALTISDHGGGWTGIGPDDSSGEVLDLSEIAAGLDAGLDAAGLERIQLLGFDACLMATYEVASALAPYADYMLASEELEPGHGWDYGALGAIAADPTIDAAGLGAAFVDGFVGQADAQGTGAEITLSLLDLAGMSALEGAMATFAGTLAEQVEGLGVLIGRQRASTVEYGRSPDPSQSTHLTDLGQFVAEIGVQSLQVSDEADAVLRAINDTVVAQTVGPARLGSTGMSIYFPPSDDLADGAYLQVPGSEAWAQFLTAYYSAGQSIPADRQPVALDQEVVAQPAPDTDGEGLGADGAEPSVVGADATVTDVEGGVEVAVQLDPAALESVVDARLSFGYIDPEDGAIVQLGDTAAEILEDGTVVGFTDLTVLTLTDADGDSVDAYLELDFDEEGTLAFASVPLDYQAPGSDVVEPVDLSIVLDAETGDVLQEVYYLLDEETGSYGELQADPTALIAPVVLVYLPDGTVEWAAYGDGALFADLPTLQYGLELLDPGTEIYVDLTVTDYGGNQLIASATFLQE